MKTHKSSDAHIVISGPSGGLGAVPAIQYARSGRTLGLHARSRKELERVQETACTHLDHGWACVDKGKYDDAIARYGEAIALDPDFAVAYALRGYAYNNNGAFDRAIADFTKAITLNSELSLAYKDRGYAHEKMGAKEQAIADFRKALEIDPTSKSAKVGLKRLGVTP